jgi:hypothetical protein
LLPRAETPFHKGLSEDPWQHGSKITKKNFFIQLTIRVIINGTHIVQ